MFLVIEARLLGFPQVCRRSQLHFAFCLDDLVLIPFKGTRRSRKLDRLVMEDRWVPLAVSWTTLCCYNSPSWGIKSLRQCPNNPNKTLAICFSLPYCPLQSHPKMLVTILFPGQQRVSRTGAEEAIAFLKTLLFPEIPERLPRALLDTSGSPSASLAEFSGVKPLISA